MTIYYMEGKEYAERTIQIPNSNTNVSDEKMKQIKKDSRRSPKVYGYLGKNTWSIISIPP